MVPAAGLALLWGLRYSGSGADNLIRRRCVVIGHSGTRPSRLLALGTLLCLLTLAPAAQAQEDLRCAPGRKVERSLRAAEKAAAELRGLLAGERAPHRRQAAERALAELERALGKLDRQLSVGPPPPPPPAPVEMVELGPPPLSPAAAAALEGAVAREPFSPGKQRVLDEALRDNRLTVAQLRRLLALFPFDREKVEAAARAYPALVDPESFFLVYQDLTFDSDKEELRRRVGR